MVKQIDKNEARLRRHRRVRNKISGTAARPRLDVEAAAEIGKKVAAKALEKGITEVVFDRGGYVYHGRVKALADGAREGGLKL